MQLSQKSGPIGKLAVKNLAWPLGHQVWPIFDVECYWTYVKKDKKLVLSVSGGILGHLALVDISKKL